MGLSFTQSVLNSLFFTQSDSLGKTSEVAEKKKRPKNSVVLNVSVTREGIMHWGFSAHNLYNNATYLNTCTGLIPKHAKQIKIN